MYLRGYREFGENSFRQSDDALQTLRAILYRYLLRQ